MNEKETIALIQRRLAKIEGQIRGLSRMVGSDRPCEEVFHQIQAVKAGISKVGAIILEHNVTECLEEDGASEEKLTRLRKLLVKIMSS